MHVAEPACVKDSFLQTLVREEADGWISQGAQDTLLDLGRLCQSIALLMRLSRSKILTDQLQQARE